MAPSPTFEPSATYYEVRWTEGDYPKSRRHSTLIEAEDFKLAMERSPFNPKGDLAIWRVDERQMMDV